MINIENIIPQKNLIILSPHYDDVPLTFGGYLDALSQKKLISDAPEDKSVRIIMLFSRSNYQARDDRGNADTSLARIQHATGIRQIEDLCCLDQIMGRCNYSYEIKFETECVLRAKGWKEGEEFEFPQGNKSTYDEDDWNIYKRFRKYSKKWLLKDNTALLLPLGIKEHIDHVLIRDAVLDTMVELGAGMRAALYFGEDQPYTGLASEEDFNKANKIITAFGLKPLDYEINAGRKADLIMQNYPTQIEESYKKGILLRSELLSEEHGINRGVERMYGLKN
ncbi:MAG: hypothetical protein ABIA63_09695 [bacterium]